jgi:cardiolipin synthase A/B
MRYARESLPSWLRYSRRTLVHMAKRGTAILLAAQVVVIGVLMTIDAWRKRYRSQGGFPRTLPRAGTVADSEVRIYTYGEDLYASMLDAIAHAQEQICLETFIWKGDELGQRFKDALYRAAERGVTVYVVYDAFANLVVPRAFKRFPPPLHVLRYPLAPWPLNPFHVRSYARDHRKILVVDGDIAFVGGYNIGSGPDQAAAAAWRADSE